MLKEFRFNNWKSYKKANLYVDPLTVLIGMNASGKSNALDGIAYLSRISQGKDLQTALIGDPTIFDTSINSIRGGVEWAAKKPETQFCLEVVIQDSDNTDYEYSITVNTSPQVELVAESLTRIETQSKNKRVELYVATVEESDSPSITVHLYNGRGAKKKKQYKRNVSVLSQLINQELKEEIQLGVEVLVNDLSNIFILDPVPTLMRDYKPFSKQLASNASNLAGVLAALPKVRKNRIEKLLSTYVSRLPEGDIKRVWAEPIGKFKSDAMLYCEENWVKEKPLLIDARGMSDGTLRFLGILTALLTRPSGSLIVIEEVDNGLHPSRSKLLLEILNEIGADRGIDILVTTHNPALMDQLGPDMIPFIIVAHRSTKTGNSRLTLLEDIENLPKLLASGPIGKIVTRGDVEEILTEQGENTDAQ